MNREDELVVLAVRGDRVISARKAAGYKSQDAMAKAMKRSLGRFSLKMYRGLEAGTRDFELREFMIFQRLTGATIEFLTGQSGTIDVSEATGLYLSSPVPVAA